MQDEAKVSFHPSTLAPMAVLLSVIFLSFHKGMVPSLKKGQIRMRENILRARG